MHTRGLPPSPTRVLFFQLAKEGDSNGKIARPARFGAIGISVTFPYSQLVSCALVHEVLESRKGVYLTTLSLSLCVVQLLRLAHCFLVARLGVFFDR